MADDLPFGRIAGIQGFELRQSDRGVKFGAVCISFSIAWVLPSSKHTAKMFAVPV